MADVIETDMGAIAAGLSKLVLAGRLRAASQPGDAEVAELRARLVQEGLAPLTGGDGGEGDAADEARARLGQGTRAQAMPEDGTEDAMAEAVSLVRALGAAGGEAEGWSRRAGLVILVPLAEALGARAPWHDLEDGPCAERAGSLVRTAGEAEGHARALARALGGMLAGAPSQPLIEAAAGLHHVASALEMEGVEVALDGPPTLRVSRDGPYLATGEIALSNHLGDEAPLGGPRALCRCGQSATKPFCDGSHVAARFSGAKKQGRLPDEVDVYPGVGVTIEDNRLRCQHSGFCTDRLSRVFHLGEEPFVTPSGGRVDQIRAAIDKCPSGALWLRYEDREEAHLPPARPAGIEASKDGPYRITGGIRILGPDEAPEPLPKGGTDEHYTLCRCGASLNKPFCTGTHWDVGFEDPKPTDGVPSVYEWAGGQRLLLDMTRIFYARHVPDDPLIGPLFASMSPDHPERVAAWLSEVFGGPKLYSELYGGYAHMIKEHIGKRISPEQRRHWVALMAQSADEAGLPDDAEFRAAFVSYLEWGSHLAVDNSAEGASPPPQMPMPRWSWVMDAYPPGATPAPAAEEDEPDLPGEEVELEFEAHIKPLFREKDRASMTFVFDLWKEEDVREHGASILARVAAGTMPCDGAWSEEKVAVLRRWVEG